MIRFPGFKTNLSGDATVAELFFCIFRPFWCNQDEKLTSHEIEHKDYVVDSLRFAMAQCNSTIMRSYNRARGEKQSLSHEKNSSTLAKVAGTRRTNKRR